MFVLRINKPGGRQRSFDLSRFLALLAEKQDIAEAYASLWAEKNVRVGLDGMPHYANKIPGVPSVCMKVPTGGGKTFLAAAAIKPIFDSMPGRRAKAVVWLVPSDSILEQTCKALSDPGHPYRQRIDVDFSGRVEVYSKEQLLSGRNFSPSAVAEQLSIFVLGYDSFRASRKDGRKAYQENGNLAPFARCRADAEALLAGTDETALIQVIRSLNPVAIVDESHHATSELSLDMLRSFNPCFILDLTATPRRGGNVISFVDAVQLKRENMVKLPVIVYNRRTQGDVYFDALRIRARLEAEAERERAATGRYIRPIALFQAQARTGGDSATFDKIRKALLDCGVPAEQVAVKTAEINELKGRDLSSPDCPVRFIITVNALKEGWDCPFAYVLATVANRTSAVDVEQILGRVLRLPGATRNRSDALNIAYVLTSSDDFHATLEKVVAGLNNAGFSGRDVYAQDVEPGGGSATAEPEQMPLQFLPTEDVPPVDAAAIKARLDQAAAEPPPPEGEAWLAAALARNADYEAEFGAREETAADLAPQEIRDKMNLFRMNEEFAEEAARLRLPQFMLATGPGLFSDSGHVPLQQEHLYKGFTLTDKDAQIDFSTMAAEMARVDVDDARDATPKAWKLTGVDGAYYKEWFASLPSKQRVAHCKQIVRAQLSKLDAIQDRELGGYIDRVMGSLTPDQLAELERSPYPFVQKIKEKILALLTVHAAGVFELWLEQGVISCLPSYALPSTTTPTEVTSAIPKSLYAAEEKMNDFEIRVVWGLSALDNVKWWHRNISRLGFCVNGYLHAYPDIIVMTTAGRLLLVETKGDHLDNAESEQKARIGDKWETAAGKPYKYFMVFDTRQPSYPRAFSLDRFMEIVKGL